MVQKALKAAEILEQQDIRIEVVDLRSLNPLDKETILRSTEKTGRLLIVHQAATTSGFGAEIAALVAREGFEFLISPIRRLGALDVPVPFSPKLENHVVPNEEKIVAEVLNMVAE
jgi:pyruvate dehydrogenase E1 component beta subunit